MQILWIKPEPPGFGNTVARLNVALNDDVRLFGLRLVEKADGRRLVYAPNAGGTRVVTFSPSLVEEIARAATAALELSPNDRTHS